MKRGTTAALMGMLALPQALLSMDAPAAGDEVVREDMPGLRLLLSDFPPCERARIISNLDDAFFQVRMAEQAFRSERGRAFCRKIVELYLHATLPAEELGRVSEAVRQQMGPHAFDKALPVFTAARSVVARENGIGYEEGSPVQTLLSLYLATNTKGRDVAEAIGVPADSPEAPERVVAHQEVVFSCLEKGVARWYRGYISDDGDNESADEAAVS